MKPNYRKNPSRPIDRDILQAAAIIRYREWDAAMIRRHGLLYYRAMGYSVQ